MMNLSRNTQRPIPCDDGYFGPNSVTWRVLSDPSAWLGGGRALLIQALHPAAVAVFAANTDYHCDPWGRIRRTASYLETTVFGDTRQAEAAGARLRALHARLHGLDPETGRERRADDPDLLLWIHSTATHSFVAAYRRYAHRLSEQDQDRYVREMVRSAELVGLPACDVPASMGELREYLGGVADLRATPAAMQGMEMILRTPPIPGIFRPIWAAGALSIVSLLPERVRELYGIKWVRGIGAPIRLSTFTASRIYNVVAARAVRKRYSSLDRATSGTQSPAPALGRP